MICCPDCGQRVYPGDPGCDTEACSLRATLAEMRILSEAWIRAGREHVAYDGDRIGRGMVHLRIAVRRGRSVETIRLRYDPREGAA